MSIYHIDAVAVANEFLLEQWKEIIGRKVNLPNLIHNLNSEYTYSYVYFPDSKITCLLSSHEETHSALNQFLRIATLDKTTWVVLLPNLTDIPASIAITTPQSSQTYIVNDGKIIIDNETKDSIKKIITNSNHDYIKKSLEMPTNSFRPLTARNHKYSPYDTQPCQQTHYKQQSIQPLQYTVANKLNFNEGNIVKYITRHRLKNGIDDLKKVIHYALFEAYHSYSEDEFDNLIQWLRDEINPKSEQEPTTEGNFEGISSH